MDQANNSAPSTPRKLSRAEMRQAKRELKRREWQQYLEQYEARYGAPPEEDYEENQRIISSYRRKSILKWTLGLTGLGMVGFTGLAMLILIVVPVWFRGLEPAERNAWENRIPLLAAFQPTREYSAERLPTVASNDADAMSLLATPINRVVTTGGSDGLSSSNIFGGGDAGVGGGGNGNNASAPVPTATGTPTPTIAFNNNAAPTSVLTTTTPVLAAIQVTTAPPTPTAMLLMPTPSPAPTIPPPPVPTAVPAPPAFDSTGFRFEKQGWNECGPANLTQALRFLGWGGTLTQAVAALKGHREDRNVSPWEMVNYVNETLNRQNGVGIRALMRVGGDLDLVKRLVANNFAVIIEKGYVLNQEGWMGHYLTIQGYDDSKGQVHGLDTYLGNRWEDYDKLDERWQQFNRVFVVFYPVERERELAILLGPYRDDRYSIEQALNTARTEAFSKPDNQYSWFNIGTNYVLLRDYANAVKAYNKSASLGGWQFRMLWYQFGPYEAYYNMGDYQNVLSLAEVTLKTSPYLEESHYWRGMALAALGRADAAQESFQRALQINARFQPASEALAQVRNGSFKPPVG